MDSGNAKNAATSIQFKNFDVVPLAKDHHYLKSDKHKQGFNEGTNAANIMKEWEILDKNLPESIYVQVYETRIDLLRAVIIGAAGTPYHDGLFFFDIALPSDYPKTPPKVHYHAHGYALNPNLYASGYVCISLINTWDGRKSERWSKKSTILQLLVSIQGLVLNERPYFNEPGYGIHEKRKSSKWINASIKYNEDAFIYSGKSMLKIMRRPPANFEDFVVRHFSSRAASILEAIKHYREGHVLVGQFEMNAASSSSSSARVSSKFKASLVSIQSKLNGAFARMISEPNKDTKKRKRGASR